MAVVHGAFREKLAYIIFTVGTFDLSGSTPRSITVIRSSFGVKLPLAVCMIVYKLQGAVAFGA